MASSIPAQARDAWGALVSCSYMGDVNVGTGYGSGSTQQAAVARATRDAMSSTNHSSQWKCSTARAFDRGCGYIVGGFKGNHGGFAIGATLEEALTKLQDKGLSRDPTQGHGGCVGR